MSNLDPLLEALTPKSDWYVVLRPFQGDGEDRYVRGEVVDAAAWMHRRRLVDLRYIAPLPFGATVPDTDANGRRIVMLDDVASAEIHPQRRPAEPVPVTVEPVEDTPVVVAESSAPTRPVPVRKPKAAAKPRKATQQ